MHIRLLPLLVGVVAAALVACGPAPQAGPRVNPGGDSTGTPKSGGVLNMSANVDPFNYDITIAKTTPNDDVIALTYSSLLRWRDGGPYTEMVLEPDLAERWEVSPDAKKFTFHLRKGVKYQDLPPVNGRELTSADVKFSAEYRLRTGETRPSDKLPKQAEAGYILEGLDRVETPDPYTAVFHFKEPFIPFINYAASDWNPVVPREIYDRDGNFENTIVGTGPYILDNSASQKGTRWIFKKNPAYWEPGLPHLDEIRMLILPQEATEFAAFQTGQLDILNTSLDHEPAEHVRKSNPNAVEFKFLEPRANQMYLSQMPKRNSPVRDIRIRKAIALAIDRDEINRTLFGGAGEWGMPGAMHGFFTEAEARKHYKHDLAEAKRLVVEAGYPNGVSLEWPVPNTEDKTNVSLIELIQAQIKKAGLNMEMSFMDKTDQRKLRKTYDFDLDMGFGAGGLHDDPESLFFARYHSKSKGNYSYVRDPEMDGLVEAQRAEPDPEKRRGIIRQISLRALENAYTIELLYRPKWNFWHPYVKNYQPHFSDQAPYDFIWLDK